LGIITGKSLAKDSAVRGKRRLFSAPPKVDRTRHGQSPEVRLHSTSHYFLGRPERHRRRVLFSNFGTDHAPLIEEMARWKKDGRRYPKVLTARTRTPRMHMAAGYAMATGRWTAVMVHVDTRARRIPRWRCTTRAAGRLPLVLMAGKRLTPCTASCRSRDNYVHSSRSRSTSPDRAALRQWEWTLPSGVMTKETLRRAHTVATAIHGPVYLMLPRETLIQTWTSGDAPVPAGALRRGVRRRRRCPRPSRRSRTSCLAARHPVMVTSYAGRKHEAAGADRGDRAPRGDPRVRSEPALFNISPPRRALPESCRHRGRPTSGCSSTSTCRGSRSTRKENRRPGGGTSTWTW